MNMQTFFDQRLFGQPQAISYIVDITRLIKTDLSRPEKPIANLFRRLIRCWKNSISQTII